MTHYHYPNMINPFDQLDAQSIESRLAQVSTSELADTHNPLDADKLPPYYCPACKEYKTHNNPYKTGYHCYDCECPTQLVNSCFEPPRHDNTHAIEQLITNATLYALGITNE